MCWFEIRVFLFELPSSIVYFFRLGEDEEQYFVCYVEKMKNGVSFVMREDGECCFVCLAEKVKNGAFVRSLGHTKFIGVRKVNES